MPGAMSATTTALPGSRRLGVYASFVRFEHTLFSLPLIVAGVFSAPGPALSATRWLLIAVAAVGARTSAMALNRLIDRRLDALNPRTQTRELPAGRMKLAEAVALLLASIAAYLLACAALGPWYLRVAAVPLVVFTAYPYLKRFTPLCHVGVGLALALAPLAGYAAAHPKLEAPGAALWVAGFALTWVTGFDIIYATLDETFDRAHGLHSLVAWLGRKQALRVSALLHVAAYACLIEMVRQIWGGELWAGPRWTFPVVVLLLSSAGLLLYLEQRWAENVNLAFFKVNVYVGFVVLATVLVARLGSGSGFFEQSSAASF
jgi:4-hydroxybenzoate polyprenyltransferase